MNTDGLARRVEKLETSNKRVRMLLLIVVAAAVWPWLSGAVEDPRAQTLRGRRVLLFDGDNKLRAFLGPDEDQDGRVGLYLYDRAGKRSAAFFVKDDQTGLALFGEKNTERVRLELSDTGTALRLYTPDKHQRARLTLTDTQSSLALGTDAQDPEAQGHAMVEKHGLTLVCEGGTDGYSKLSMGHEQDGAHTRLGTGDQGSYLLLRDADGKSRVQLKPSQDDPSIQISGHQTGPVIAVFDAEGNRVNPLP